VQHAYASIKALPQLMMKSLKMMTLTKRDVPRTGCQISQSSHSTQTCLTWSLTSASSSSSNRVSSSNLVSSSNRVSSSSSSRATGCLILKLLRRQIQQTQPTLSGLLLLTFTRLLWGCLMGSAHPEVSPLIYSSYSLALTGARRGGVPRLLLQAGEGVMAGPATLLQDC